MSKKTNQWSKTVWYGMVLKPKQPRPICSFAVWATGALPRPDFIGLCAAMLSHGCFFDWIQIHFSRFLVGHWYQRIHLWLVKRGSVPRSALWRCWPGAAVLDCGSENAGRQRGGESEREGEVESKKLWSSFYASGLLIGWWRAMLSVYPWPSYLLISPPPPLALLPQLAFGAPSRPPWTVLIPSASPLQNNSDLIWPSPSDCQGLAGANVRQDSLRLD